MSFRATFLSEINVSVTPVVVSRSSRKPRRSRNNPVLPSDAEGDADKIGGSSSEEEQMAKYEEALKETVGPSTLLAKRLAKRRILEGELLNAEAAEATQNNDGSWAGFMPEFNRRFCHPSGMDFRDDGSGGGASLTTGKLL